MPIPIVHPTAHPTGRPAGRWLISRDAGQDAAVNLYCFPHAGGSPGEYARWSDDLADVRVWGVQAPGRGSRAREPSFTAMRPLVDAVIDAVPFEPPFALFGHSLGGLVAFEVARSLRDRGRALPQRLLVSATPPPSSGRRPALSTLSDDELLDEVGRRWGGLPPAVSGDPRVRKLAVRQFRADLAIFETYKYVPGAPLSCPVTALAGHAEQETLGMERWAAHTDAGLDLHVLPGGHFYHRERRAEVLALIQNALTADLVAQGGEPS